MPGPNRLLTINGEPPAWDAFSKVNVDRIDPSEYEDEAETQARLTKKETAIVKAKPTTLSGWDPETKTQSILTEEQMEQGAGMGAIDLDHWKVTSMTKKDLGTTMDASHGSRTVMKKLVEVGSGTTNPHPPAQVMLTYVGRVRDPEDPDGAGLLFDEAHWEVPTVFNLSLIHI